MTRSWAYQMRLDYAITFFLYFLSFLPGSCVPWVVFSAELFGSGKILTPISRPLSPNTNFHRQDFSRPFPQLTKTQHQPWPKIEFQQLANTATAVRQHAKMLVQSHRYHARTDVTLIKLGALFFCLSISLYFFGRALVPVITDPTSTKYDIAELVVTVTILSLMLGW